MKTKNNFYVLDDEETLIKFSDFEGNFEELKYAYREFNNTLIEEQCFNYYRDLSQYLKCDIEIITERRF